MNNKYETVTKDICDVSVHEGYPLIPFFWDGII